MTTDMHTLRCMGVVANVCRCFCKTCWASGWLQFLLQSGHHEQHATLKGCQCSH
jgi:hypothetical protein